MRRHALACFEAALAAVDPRRLVREALSVEEAKPTHLVAFGKASITMTQGAIDVLGERLTGGVVLAPQGAEASLRTLHERFSLHRGRHPIPDESNVEGARALQDFAANLTPSDVLLCLISGGGSALLTLPPANVALEDVRSVTDALLRAGADIDALNTVRKHLDQLKGGRLAAATPAKIVGLVLSDVIGDRLDVVASGPLTPDSTQPDDAIATLRRLELWDDAPSSVREHLRRSAAPPKPRNDADVRVIGSASLAAEAAAAHARTLGYAVCVLDTQVVGEARDAGREIVRRALAQEIERPTCLIFAGETTVTVRGDGRGGRNQELALGAALEIEGRGDVLVASLATDGVDGPTDAAGAIATGETIARARSLGLDADASLRNNDCYAFWRALGDLVVVGPTGTNVNDLQFVFLS